MGMIFVPGPTGCFPKSTDLRGLLMKSLKLIGLALGASLALSTAALAQDITIAVAGPLTGGGSAFGRQVKDGPEQAGGGLNEARGADRPDPRHVRGVAALRPAP